MGSSSSNVLDLASLEVQRMVQYHTITHSHFDDSKMLR